MEGAIPGQMPPQNSRNFRNTGATAYGYPTYSPQQQDCYNGPAAGAPMMYGQSQYDPRSRGRSGSSSGFYPSAMGGYYTHQSPPQSTFQGAYGYFTEVQQTPLGSLGKRRPRTNSSSSSGGTNSGSDDDARNRKANANIARSQSLGSIDATTGTNIPFIPGAIDPVHEHGSTVFSSEDMVNDDRQRRGSFAKHSAKRRPTHGEPATKHRKPGSRGGRGTGDILDTYVLRCASDDETDEEIHDWPSPPTTLETEEYRRIFETLNSQFCHTAFRWLARYKFRIPKKSFMKEHVSPADRELTEYVQIIKTLIENREVPRTSVRDERISELGSVMEGAAEIRHVTIHVSRKHKPDQRVLGFIAAVSEFCWILGDAKGAAAMNRLYYDTEKLTKDRQLQVLGKRSPRALVSNPRALD